MTLDALMRRFERRFKSRLVIGAFNAGRAVGCWQWTGARLHPHGNRYKNIVYGWVRWPRDKHPTTAHRVAYRLFVGEIPVGMTVDHICFNPLCCNPAHLQLLTASENAARKNPAKRGAPRQRQQETA